MKISRSLLSLLLVSVVIVTPSQNEILTNQLIIDMARAGLSQEVLLRKINTANCRFDTTATALIELKKAGVPDRVVEAIIDRQSLIPPNTQPDGTPAFSESGSTPNPLATLPGPELSTRQSVASAKSIAFGKSSAHPTRQALEKELMKRRDFRSTGLAITRYKDSADLYIEIGYVSMSWITHRYVYRIYDRRSGAVVAAGETTSWGSLAENLARHIAKDLATLRG